MRRRAGSLQVRHGRAAAVWPLLLVLLALALVPLHVRGYPALSPIDELQHLDYVERAPGLQPVVTGDRIGQESLRAEACRGVDAAFTPPPCGEEVYDPQEFQEEGYNTAYIHPPTYYSLTAIAAAPVEGLTGVSTMTAARLVGAGWLAAGLVLSYLLARRLGAGRTAAGGLLLLVGASPGLLYWASVVNPDSASLAVGAGCALLVLAWERRTSGGWWLLAAAGVLGVAVKLQNLLVLLVLGLYLALRAVRARGAAGQDGEPPGGRSWREHAVAVVVLGLPGMVAAGAWSALVSARAAVPADQLPMAERFAVDELVVSRVTSALGRFLSPVSDPLVPNFLQHGTVLAVVALVASLLVAGAVAAGLFVERLDAGVADLGRAVLVLSLVGAPLFVVLNHVLFGVYFEIPARYGLTLVGPVAALTAAQITHRRTAQGVAVVGVLAALVMASAAVR